jgi:AbrB family looped-hinge helix DNA binding protein
MATVTSKGQITIPKSVRVALGLAPGSQVDFSLGEGEVVLRKRVSPEALSRWQGYLRDRLPAGSVDEFVDMLRGERLSESEGGDEDSSR